MSTTADSVRERAAATGGSSAPVLERPVLRAAGRRRVRVPQALRVVGPVGLLLLWWVLTATGAVATDVLPGPWAVARNLGDLWQHQHLAHQVAVSLQRVLTGLVLGGGAALVLGCLVGLSPLGEALFDSSVQMLRTIPFVALSPLFIVWLGIGSLTRETIVALACSFPMYINTVSGVRNVDRKVVEAAACFGLSRTRTVSQVVLPLALPSILAGLRYALGVAVLALVVAEQIDAQAGIGYLMSNAQSINDVRTILSCVVLYAGFGIAGDLAVRLLERLVLPWRRGVALR